MILTDSTSDLNREYLIKEDVQSIPLFIRFEEEVYKDGLDITPEELYKQVKEKKELAHSTGLRSGDFHNAFNKYIKRGYDIVYIGIGSNLSSTIQSALIAKQELATNQVYIIDSKTMSSGLALLVMRAVELRNEGKTGLQIKNVIDELVQRVHFYYMISDLDILGMRFRIKPRNLKIAKFMNTKPVVTMINDRVETIKHFVGSLEKNITHFIKLVERKTKGLRIEELYITHSCSDEFAEMSSKLILNRLKPKKLTMSHIGCVLGAQVGKYTIGLSYFLSDEQRRD